MISVGLTGGIGSGKTTIAKLFSDIGAITMEADQIAHQALKQGQDAWKEVVSLFGQRILIPGENEIDRSKLAKIVFENRKALTYLLDIIYPYVNKELIKRLSFESRKGTEVFLFDASQILEAGWENIFDVIILVMARIDVRRERLLRTDRLDLTQICLRSYFQWPDWVKIRYADFLIDNSGPLWKTERIVKSIYRQLTAI